MRIVVLSLAMAVLVHAASPIRFEYGCPEKDIDSFGLNCSDREPCPVFLELVSAESTGTTIFVVGNIHTQTTTLYAILLRSSDGGETWSEPAGRMRAAALDEIQFADLQHGWISGLFLEPLPRDPFLLVTSDGGATWTPRQLFSERRYASIQQFWFDSVEEGETVVENSLVGDDRFQLYHSGNGGQSWALKSAGPQPPVLTKANSKSQWRVRPDAPAKTNRIERRSSPAEDNWETVAMFPVEVANCK